MRKEIEELLNKPTTELSAQELRLLAEDAARREDEERTQQLEQIHKAQAKVQKEIEALTTKLTEKRQELKDLQVSASTLAVKRTSRGITRLNPDSITDMITLALYDANEPLGIDAIYAIVAADLERVGKGGKNPKQAIGSTLSSLGRFEAVRRGVYQLTNETREEVAAIRGDAGKK
jgi:hypothetical protein